eukprot:SM000089S23842  [mRNA]  locus=s89:342975:343605:- [translate_table: standard]
MVIVHDEAVAGREAQAQALQATVAAAVQAGVAACPVACAALAAGTPAGALRDLEDLQQPEHLLVFASCNEGGRSSEKNDEGGEAWWRCGVGGEDRVEDGEGNGGTASAQGAPIGDGQWDRAALCVPAPSDWLLDGDSTLACARLTCRSKQQS